MKLNMIYILIIAKITLIELTEIAIRTKKSQKTKTRIKNQILKKKKKKRKKKQSDTKQEYNLV